MPRMPLQPASDDAPNRNFFYSDVCVSFVRVVSGDAGGEVALKEVRSFRVQDHYDNSGDTTAVNAAVNEEGDYDLIFSGSFLAITKQRSLERCGTTT